MKKKRNISISFFLFALFTGYVLFGVIFELFFEKYPLFSFLEVGRNLSFLYHLGEFLLIFLALGYFYLYFKSYKDSFLFAFLFLGATVVTHLFELVILLINPVGTKNYFYLNQVNGVDNYNVAGVYAHPITLVYSYGVLMLVLALVGFFVWRDWKKVSK